MKKGTMAAVLAMVMLFMSGMLGIPARASDAGNAGDKETIHLSAPMGKYVFAFVKAHDAHKFKVKLNGGISFPSAWLFSRKGTLLTEVHVVYHPDGKVKYDVVVNRTGKADRKPNWTVFAEILEKSSAFKRQRTPGGAILLIARPPEGHCSACRSFEHAVSSAVAKYDAGFRTIELTVSG